MDVIARINYYILNPIIIFLFAAAVLYFLWGLLAFIQHQDDTTAQEEGKRHMVWGVIGIFLMAAVYGILNLVQSTVTTLIP